MPSTSLYSESAAVTRCRDCHATIQRRTRFCDRCRARRRALTFARQAHDYAIAAGENHIAGQLGVIVGALEEPAR